MSLTHNYEIKSHNYIILLTKVDKSQNYYFIIKHLMSQLRLCMTYTNTCLCCGNKWALDIFINIKSISVCNVNVNCPLIIHTALGLC